MAACVARLAAIELIGGSRWWNRWRLRLMARALVACAEEMELAADMGAGAMPGPRAVPAVPAPAGSARRWNSRFTSCPDMT